MAWLKVDDKFHSHPKVVRAGNAATGLFIRCCAWSAQHETDGRIPQAIAEMYGQSDDIDTVTRVGLWRQEDDEFVVPDFLEFNPSRDELRAERERRSDVGRRAANARWSKQSDAGTHAPGNASSNASSTGGPDAPSRPVPSRDLSSSVDGFNSDAELSTDDDALIGKVLGKVADMRTDRAKRDNRSGYRRKVLRNLRDELGDTAARLCREYPSAPIDVLAAAVEGDMHSLRYHERQQT